MTDLSIDEFDEVFQRFAGSPTSTAVFRWEALQDYAVDYDDASLQAWRNGTARPERSIRTDPWLARIAASTLDGKQWSRVRYVIEPRTEYTDWELLAYQESQAVGERVFVILRTTCTLPDFWLFSDPGGDCAVIIHYDGAGVPTSFEYLDADDRLAPLREASVQVHADAMPLNAYLARDAEAPGGR